MKPLSFIIITYNRPGDALELVKNISRLDGAVELLQEIIIVNNKSTVSYDEVKDFISSKPELPFRYLEAEENLGVARGRNYALKFATAPILILLDDDAVLQNSDSLKNVIAAFEHKPKQGEMLERETAIVSFKVLYYDTLEMQVNALPHKKFEKYKNYLIKEKPCRVLQGFFMEKRIELTPLLHSRLLPGLMVTSGVFVNRSAPCNSKA